MSDTHSLGRFFWARQELAPEAPRKSETTVYDIEYPFRIGYGTVRRLRGSHGVVFGRWHQEINPDDDDAVQKHLLAALQSAQGPDAFLAESREKEAAQGEMYEPSDGYLTGENDGPQENLGQIAEYTGRVFEVDEDGNPVRELTEGML